MVRRIIFHAFRDTSNFSAGHSSAFILCHTLRLHSNKLSALLETSVVFITVLESLTPSLSLQRQYQVWACPKLFDLKVCLISLMQTVLENSMSPVRFEKDRKC